MNRNTSHYHLSILVIIATLVLLPVYQATNLSNIVEQTYNSQHVISPLDGPMNSSWPMYCHDAQRTSRSPYAAEGRFGVERWRFQFGDMISRTSPAIANDGTIYTGGPDFYLMAINSDGTEKWRFQCNGYVVSSPAISDDGTIYVGADGHKGYLYAVNPNGTMKWRTLIGNSWTRGSPVIDRQGVIYITALAFERGHIAAVYPNGTVKWNYLADGLVYCSPTLNHDESVVYCGSNDGRLYALYTSNGTRYWRYNTGGGLGTASTVAADGTIYVGSASGYLTAVHPNGTMIWKTKVGYCAGSSPALASDGTIYIGNAGDDPCSLISVNPMNGSINWEYEVDESIISSPAVDANGVIYFGSQNGLLYAVNPDGTLRWKFDTGGHVECSPAIDEFGRIYFMSHVHISRSYFFCLETTDEAAILELGEITPRFAHISISVTNTGNIAANDLTWTILMDINPFTIFKPEYQGNINNLNPGETRTIRSWLTIGFGLLHVVINVQSDDAGLVHTEEYLYLIGPFLIVRPEYC